MLRTVLLISCSLAFAGVAVAQETKKQPPKAQATAAADLATLMGFKVELLASSDASTEGSWINLDKDPQGRLIVGGQRGQPTLRMTIKDGKVERTEKLKLQITEVMGLLFAHESLYVMGEGPKGYGIYRCRESSMAGEFDV